MIAIGSDHGGVALKDTIKEYFDENGIEYKDYGTQKDVPADYPDIAEIVCGGILNGECSSGVLVCGTGIGMSIAAKQNRRDKSGSCNRRVLSKNGKGTQ